MTKIMFFLFLILFHCTGMKAGSLSEKPVRLLVVTGGHDYNRDKFSEMLTGLGRKISFMIAELPDAFIMFEPENRNKYDVILFYHMWQDINGTEKKNLSDCIRDGKPLVVLHHSICAFDNWPEYIDIIGGKYFHKPTVVNGKEYPACSYLHDVHFRVKISDKRHPVAAGLDDFDLFDETYKGFYVEPGVTRLLTTEESSSNEVIGWAKEYGRSRIVTLQCGHDVPTYTNPHFKKLLKQSVEWVYNSGKESK